MVNRYTEMGDKVVLNVANGYLKTVPNVDNIHARLVAQNEVEYIASSLGKDELYLEELERLEQTRKAMFKGCAIWGNATMVVLPTSLYILACGGDVLPHLTELATYLPLGLTIGNAISFLVYGRSYKKDIASYKKMIDYEKQALSVKEEELRLIESDNTFTLKEDTNDVIFKECEVIIDSKVFDDLRKMYYEFGMNKKKFQKLYRAGMLESMLFEAEYCEEAIYGFLKAQKVELSEQVRKGFVLKKTIQSR